MTNYQTTETRRTFLTKSAAALSLVNIQTACTPARATTRGACYHDCPDRCAWLATTEDGRAVDLQGDPNHPLTRGRLCEKMTGYLTDVVYNPDRLLHPLRRTGAKGEAAFERVTWDEAIDDIAARLQSVIDEHGPTAILPYSYAGTQGLVQGSSLDRRFFARLGATRLERKVCGSASSEGLIATTGAFDGILAEDVVHSRLILVWGTNPAVTNTHVWPLILKAQAAGARVVVIDPIETLSARAADQHIQPLPGTDAALALGMMHVIVRDGLQDDDYIEQHTLGFDQLRGRIAEYTPERAAALTGLTLEVIVELARSYAQTRPAVIRTLIGMEHHGNGAMTYRTIACLPALTGAWRERGGGMLSYTAACFGKALNRGAVGMGELEDRTIRSVNMVQLGRALTSATLDPPINAIVVYNSNPATIAPNQNLVHAGLKREDLFTVVMDHFVTDTARFADYVLPAATHAECLDLLTSWGSHYLSLNLPAIDPPGEALTNTDFFRRLARRLGLEDAYLYDSDETIIKAALNSDDPYLEGITYERLRAEGWAPLNIPQPWMPFAGGSFDTPSGKCEFYSADLKAQGLDPLPAYNAATPTEAEHPLILLSPKSSRMFLNSSHANQPRHLAAEVEPLLEMNEADAVPRGIAEGDLVRVHNQRGSVQLRVRIKNRIRAGVVSMPHGWWPSRLPGNVSANALTPDGLSDLGGGSDFHDTAVEVAPVSNA